MSAPVAHVTSVRRDRLGIVAVVVGALVVFAPVLAGRLPLVRDLPGFTLPSRLLWRAAVREGRLPQWNPFVELGVPMLATPVHGALYPGQLPIAVLPPDLGFGLVWLLHAIAGGLGALALARELGCGGAAAAIAGLVQAVGGYSVSMWGNGEKVTSGAWVPIAAWLLVRAAKAPALGLDLLLAAAALAMAALAGDPFLWLHALALGVPLAWAVTARDGDVSRPIARAVGRSALVVALAMLLAAPVLVPAWLERAQTARAGDLPASIAEAWSMHPGHLLDFVAPGAMGNPNDLEHYPGGMFSEAPTVQALPWALSIYAGAACLGLAPLGLASRVGATLAATAGIGTLAALGSHTPFYAALRALVPPLRWMRYPEKHFLLATLALSLLAALGAERLLRARGATRPVAFVATFPVLLGAVGLAVAPAPIRPFAAWGAAHVALAAAALAGALALARRRPAWRLLVPVVVVVDLGLAVRPLLPWVSARSLAARPALADDVLAGGGAEPPRIWRIRRDYLDVASLAENVGAPYGIASFPGHDPAKSPTLHAVEERLAERKLAPLLGLRWSLDPSPNGSPPAWRLHELGRLPRVWLAQRVEALDDAAALERMARADFEPWTTAIVPTDANADAPDPRGRCAVASHRPERIALRCETAGPALAVVSEQWAPGWTATIDGTPAEVLRADLVLRAVRLPPGRHDVLFSYRTPGLATGAALGAAGWSAVIALGAALRFRGRRRSRCA